MSIRIRKARRDRRGGTPAPPPGFITVSNVDWLGGGAPDFCVWIFSHDFTVTGLVPELTVNGQAPISTGQLGTNEVLAQYPAPLAGGEPWSISSAPSNVDESADVVVPQSGNIDLS